MAAVVVSWDTDDCGTQGDRQGALAVWEEAEEEEEEDGAGNELEA